MANKEKIFNTKLYAIVTFVVIAALLAVICVSTFSARYIGFHPDELAKTYVDTIVQTGDGYNAYKNTLVSKSSKYGDFIRKYYINPEIYRDTEFKVEDDTANYIGYNDEKYMSDTTINDDGTLSGQLIDAMYPFYEELVSSCGWDDYDYMFSNYIGKLIEVRQEIFGDKYLTDEIFFTAFEANVAMYGDWIKGTKDTFDENSGVQLTYASTGIYEEVYGEDYKINVAVVAEDGIDIDDYKSAVDIVTFSTYGVDKDDISEAKEMTVEVRLADEKILAVVDVVIVKIGMAWYVDNTATDTSALYDFYSEK